MVVLSVYRNQGYYTHPHENHSQLQQQHHHQQQQQAQQQQQQDHFEENVLHPDVIVDTEEQPLSDCSSDVQMQDEDELDYSMVGIMGGGERSRRLKLRSGRGAGTSTDDGGGDDLSTTNYELIEYLKRREQRDEEMLRRMDAREERLLGLFERTVVAIEMLTAVVPKHNCKDMPLDKEKPVAEEVETIQLVSKGDEAFKDLSIDTSQDDPIDPDTEKEEMVKESNVTKKIIETLQEESTVVKET